MICERTRTLVVGFGSSHHLASLEVPLGFVFGFSTSLALIAKRGHDEFPFCLISFLNQSPIIFSSLVASAPSTLGFTSPLGFVGRTFCSFPMNRRWKSS